MGETIRDVAYGVAVADVPVSTSHQEDGERGERRRAARGLAALLGAMFLGNVDVAIANVAGPSIRSGLLLVTGPRVGVDQPAGLIACRSRAATSELGG